MSSRFGSVAKDCGARCRPNAFAFSASVLFRRARRREVPRLEFARRTLDFLSPLSAVATSGGERAAWRRGKLKTSRRRRAPARTDGEGDRPFGWAECRREHLRRRFANRIADNRGDSFARIAVRCASIGRNLSRPLRSRLSTRSFQVELIALSFFLEESENRASLSGILLRFHFRCSRK